MVGIPGLQAGVLGIADRLRPDAAGAVAALTLIVGLNGLRLLRDAAWNRAAEYAR
ncbi:hypothetical protein [Streptomyces sp. NPDC048565]|uniref:hypothetical protein n=1 Tax=Streptomyces sp. NPDC048565 TaxID=3155266 RepID=UPI003442DF2E